MLEGFFTNLVSGVFGKVLDGLDNKREARALLRLLTLELKHNVALIDTLKADGPQWSEGAAAVARALQGDVLNMAFLPSKHYKDVHAAIAALPLPEDEDDGGAPARTQTTDGKLESLWVRLRTVQVLGQQGSLHPGQKDLRLLQRLTNLRAAMQLVIGVVKRADAE
jgi:hypothetical protein